MVIKAIPTYKYQHSKYFCILADPATIHKMSKLVNFYILDPILISVFLIL